MLWEGSTRVGAQMLLFIIQLVLARLLSPDDFGTITILTVFIALAEVFVESGFRSSLIQKKKLTDIDCQSVFWLNLVTGVVLYLILFGSAPYVADFYRRPELAMILRVLALTPVIHGLVLVNNALLLREMRFKQKQKVEWSGLIIGGIIGIFMALRGCGAWALVGMQLGQAVVSGIVVVITIRWRPHFIIDFKALVSLFKFGSFLLGVSLLSTFISNLFRLVIGRSYSLGQLGLYNMGNGIPRMGMNCLNLTMSSVLFPAFSEIQSSTGEIRKIFIMTIGLINFLVFPLLFCMVATAQPLVRVLLGEQWTDAAILLQINSLAYLFWPSHLINVQVCNSTGKSRLCFLLELIKDVVFVCIIWITCHFSICVMCWGFVLYSVVSFFLNAWPTRMILGYGPVAQLKALWKPLLLSGVTCLLTMLGGHLLQHIAFYWLLIIELCCFGLFYLGLNWLFNRSYFLELCNMGIKLIGTWAPIKTYAWNSRKDS